MNPYAYTPELYALDPTTATAPATARPRQDRWLQWLQAWLPAAADLAVTAAPIVALVAVTLG